MSDSHFLVLAIENSRISAREGNFPAGAIVVLNDQVVSSKISAPYPGLMHADAQALISAYEARGRLYGATLFVGLQPCLMCTCIAYWAGVRRIVYAVPRDSVSSKYYESDVDSSEFMNHFHEKVEMVHLLEFQAEATEVIRTWEISAHGM